MMLKGLGEPVVYGPTAEQLGLDPSLTGSYPFGSVGDQYQTCVAAGGDSASCMAAVVEENPTAGVLTQPSGRAPSSPSSGCAWYQQRQANGTCKASGALIAGLLAFGIVAVMKLR